MKKNKKYLSLGLAVMLSTGLLTGCGSSSTQAESASETVSYVEQTMDETTSNTIGFDYYEEIPEAKTYEPGTHLIVKRIQFNGASWQYDIDSASYEIPDGYSVVEITNDFENTGGAIGTQEATGFYIILVNNETVEVKPYYNESIAAYDYSAPGTVIQNEEAKTLTK